MDQKPPPSFPSTSGQKLPIEPPIQANNERCWRCKLFTIDQLLERKVIFHHSSLEALEQYADLGCDFCQFVLDCLKRTQVKEIPFWQRRVSVKWGDPGYDDWEIAEQSLYARGKETSQPWPIMFTIRKGMRRKLPSSKPHPSEMPDAKDVYETLIVYVDKMRFSMELNLIVSQDDNIYVDEYTVYGRQHARHRVGRHPIYPDLGSPVNLSIAKRWLDDCRENHAECRPVKTPSLPTRVLDVGISEGSDSCRLVETGNKEGNYVTLSHCWGAKIEKRLTTETLSNCLRSIQIAQLPANFRDAIYVTRQLGMQYLWIDALCILQDSEEDWASESEKMGSIYQDSTLTIFAMTSKGSEEGFLKTANPPHLKTSLTTNNQTSILVTRREVGEETLGRLRSGSALSKRGWAFQEVILSRRSLFFGGRQLYWQCRKEIDSLEGLYSFPDSECKVIRVVVPQAHGQPETSYARAQSDFYTLASEYNTKALTYSSDKLPAFSGLAQRYQHAFGGEYLAGLWSNDIDRGLLWFHVTPLSPDSAAQPNRLPSWSWASTNASVDFVEAQPRGLLEFYRSDIQLCNSQNRYGQIRSENDATRPSMTVIGMTMPLARGNKILDPQDRRPTLFGVVHFDMLEGLEEFMPSNGRLFTPLTIVDGSFMLSLLYLGDWRLEYEDEDEEREKWKDVRDLYPGLKCNYLALAVSGEFSEDYNIAVHGLVLEGSRDAFKRVGVWDVISTNWSWKGWQRDQMLKLV